MNEQHNPQAKQMADQSMPRNLAHQAQAIWPQERGLFDRYTLAGALSILDVGGGTGEITWRLAERYPQAQLVGIHCDGRIGRQSPALLEQLGYRDIAIDYLTVDTLRVPRELS